ncbi:hypothetical protein KY285_000858 [Solanum tuberosum]|nr:hypothetical protein KY289_001041 [Solanum tuberosum]KAH0764987.1 hypothetical protein KY285_000858 [Solanum tuberosum]
MAIIRTEEGRRSVMLETQINEGSALVAKRTSSKEFEVSQSESTIKSTGSYKPPFNRDNLYCTYCKKYRHTRERCWRLNGRPPNRNNSDGKQAHLASNPQADETNPHSTSAGSCSLAFTVITNNCSWTRRHTTGKSLILKDVLHEQNTKEMIGRASEKGGLYCLDVHNGGDTTKNSLSSSFLSEFVMSNKEKGESLKGERPLDLSLFDFSISGRAKSLPESSFLRSPEPLNPNELIESPNLDIDNGILENNLPLQVYSRRKRLTDQTTQLQSSHKVTAPSTYHAPVEPSETPNQTDHEEPNQPNDLDLRIALRKGTRPCTQHHLSLIVTYQNLSQNIKLFSVTSTQFLSPKICLKH